MPSFFLKSKAKSSSKVVKGKPGKRKAAVANQDNDVAAKMSRRQKIMANTELYSDDEDSLMGSPEASDAEDEVIYEDEHERNYREAKMLLEKIQSTVKDDEDVEKKLREDAVLKTGLQVKRVAETISLEDEDEICYRPHRLAPVCVAFSPDSNYVISCGKESSIAKYDIKNKKVVGVIKRSKKGSDEQVAHYGSIFALAVSNDQRFIASGGFDNFVKIWNFETLELVKNLAGHRGTIYSLCFQMKTNNLFSASQDRSVKMWDIDQMGLVDTMYGHQDGVKNISILSKQRVATVGGRDRTARLWKVEDESQLLFTGLPNCTSIDCVCLINEEYFVTGSSDGSLAIWSLWKKKPLYVHKESHGSINGVARWIVSLAVLPYSDLLATGSNEGELKLWRIGEDFKSISAFFAYSIPGFINSIQFSPNGKMIAVGAGKEHKEGRWWQEKEAKNKIILLPIRSDSDLEQNLMKVNDTSGIESGSDEDN